LGRLERKDLSPGQESGRVKKTKRRTEGKRKMTTQTSLYLLLQSRGDGGFHNEPPVNVATSMQSKPNELLVVLYYAELQYKVY
jgi:predicted cupin superfamily sugar epimerase